MYFGEIIHRGSTNRVSLATQPVPQWHIQNQDLLTLGIMIRRFSRLFPLLNEAE
jgi:hypothetical protein